MISRFSDSKRLKTAQQNDKPASRFRHRQPRETTPTNIKSRPTTRDMDRHSRWDNTLRKPLDSFKRKCEVYRYLSQGFSVFPLVAGEKTPIVNVWKPFQTRYIKRREWWDWWDKYSNANVAIACGRLSDVCVIDADSKEGRRELDKYLPVDLKTPICKTRKGWHYYFGNVEGLKNKVRFIEGCDVRAEGGYVVVSPSIVDGHQYTWLPGCSLDELPVADMPEKLLNKLLEKEPAQEPR